MKYKERSYREKFRQGDLYHFQVAIKQTDLDIGIRRDRFSSKIVEFVRKTVLKQRELLEKYIEEDHVFLHSLTPCSLKPGAPQIAIDMAEAARAAGVGPMAAVAGAFAHYVGSSLARRSRDVIVENGGDIYMRSARPRRIGVFAGCSPLSNRLALLIRPEDTPLGICTSSGTVGHSLSLGKADAVVILAPSAMLADAVATAAGNLIQTKDDVQKAAEFATRINGVGGALVIKDDRLAACGKLKIVPF
ncbi:MAG: UPF0280 family protein [Peptococcaceae bacterium]|nr:UPF0280 family protein [Peptococcaceae bacterium]